PSANLAKMAPRIPTSMPTARATATDNVPQTRIYKVWHAPQFGTVEDDRLGLLAEILGSSQSSRLHKRLMFTEKLADRVFAGVRDQEIASALQVVVDVKTGVDAARVEAAIDEEVAKLIAEGPTAAELDQARTTTVASFVRGVERIGGFGGKADVLAECQV